MFFFVGLMIVMSAVMLSSVVVGWQTVIATVTKIGAPRSCRSDRHSLFGPKQRDWVPKFRFVYCGMIYTDHGSVLLPESNRVIFGRHSREALHDSLREGCTYNLRVHGWGLPLALGAPPMGQVRGSKTLWSATPVGSCPSEGSP